MKEGVWAVRSNQSNIIVSYVASLRGQERLAPSRPPKEDLLLVQDVVGSGKNFKILKSARREGTSSRSAPSKPEKEG